MRTNSQFITSLLFLSIFLVPLAPSTSRAAESEHRFVPVTEDSGVKVARLGLDLRAGDCRMNGQYSHMIFRPDGTGTFFGWTRTLATLFGDYWHQTSKVLLNDEGRNHMWLQWVGPKMRVPENPGLGYGDPWARDFRFDPKAYPLIYSVEWWGNC